MSDNRYDRLNDLDALLLEGLEQIPAPAPSRDFDARVLSSLERRSAPWVSFWPSLRAAIGGAAVSLAATLAALTILSQAQPPTLNGAITASARPAASATIDQALDSGELRAGALTRLTRAGLPTTPRGG